MNAQNAQYRDDDLVYWHRYRGTKSPMDRDALLKRLDAAIKSRVDKWAGAVPRDVLMNEARILAVKAFDTYSPTKGAALATHVLNALLPLSRLAYTYQNTARLPENLTLRMQTYGAARERLSSHHGREPTTDELRDELGWGASEITRIRDYNRASLLESGPDVSSDFYGSGGPDEDFLLGAVYFELLPEEKALFEAFTGFNGARKVSSAELMRKYNLTRSQLAYKKSQLSAKIERILARPGFKSMGGRGSRGGKQG